MSLAGVASVIVPGLGGPCKVSWSLSPVIDGRCPASSTIRDNLLGERGLVECAIPAIPKPSGEDDMPSVPSVDDPLRALQKPLSMLPQRLVVGESGLMAPAELSDLDSVRCREREARLPLLPGRGAAEVPDMPEERLEKKGTGTSGLGTGVESVVMLLLREW